MFGWGQFSDFEIILAVLAVFYTAEAVCWIAHQAVCFVAARGGFRARRPLGLLSTEQKGWLLAAPAPWSLALVCEPWPVAVSPAGICGFDAVAPPEEHAAGDGETGDGAANNAAANNGEGSAPAAGESAAGSLAKERRWFVPWRAELSIVRENRQVWVEGKRLADFPSAPHAKAFAASLRRVAGLKENRRERGIEQELAALTDTAAIARQVTLLTQTAAPLQIAGGMLFLYVFGVAPAAYYLTLLEPAHHLWAFLAGPLGVWLAVIVSYFIAHRRLYPGDAGGRWKHCATLLFFPASALHGPYSLSRNLLAAHHPLAVAAVLCNRQTLAELARPWFLDFHYPLAERTGERSPALEVEDWYRQRLQGRLAELLRLAGVEPGDLLQPPVPYPDAQAYCPRCQAQFVVNEGTCQSCAGIALLPFVEAAPLH